MKRKSGSRKRLTEEVELRTTTLRSAETILIARRRAERQLVAAKEALELRSTELQRQREWFAVTLASIGDAVITTDVTGNVTFLNRVAEALTGWPTAEAAGKPLTEVFCIVNEQTHHAVENPVRKVLEAGRIVGLANHTALLARDGTLYAVEDSAAPIRDTDGNVAGVVMVFRDVTQQRRASEALRREREASEEVRNRLAAVVESSDDAIISKTIDGIITTWNQAAERMFGYTAREMIGRPVTTLFPPELIEEEAVILARLRRGERIESYETVRVTKAGRRLDVSLTVSPIRDASGAVIGASKIARDITQRRRADETLREETRILEILNETGRAIAAQLDLQSLVQTVTDAATQLSGAKFGAFFYNVVEDNAESYVLYALSGAPREAFARFGLPRNTAIFEPTFRGVGPLRSD
ncbi:MAG: PAS domain-containing protein, partial [Gammaproteobacteria bacterium]